MVVLRAVESWQVVVFPGAAAARQVEGPMPESDQLDTPDRPEPDRVAAVLVTARRCHFCRDAWELLVDLGSRYPLTVRTIDLESNEGAAIAARLRVPFPPVLLIDGEYFGHGRISRKKLTKTLESATRVRTSR